MRKQKIDLKKELMKYQIPEPDFEKKEECREKMRNVKYSCRMTDRQFIFGQIGFIRPYTWIGQFLMMLISCACIHYFVSTGYMDYKVVSLISAVTPFMLVFHIEELARVCQKSMLEIEMATKYSLKKLMLSKLIILGMMDLITMSCFLIFLNWYLQESLFAILLYSIVPFNITVIGMFHLLKYSEKGMYQYLAVAYVFLVSVCFMKLSDYKPLMYSNHYQNIWLIAGIISCFGMVKTLKDKWKNIGYFEALLTVEG